MCPYSDFAEHYEHIFPYREDVYAFLRHYLRSDTKRVLDIGCSTGHYCRQLAGDGFDVVGIDLDPEMIRIAQKRSPQTAFHCMNMLDVAELHPRFNFAFSFGNVLSHLKKTELNPFLNNLATTLLPNSLWIFQIVNWDFLLTQKSYQFPDKTEKRTHLTLHRKYQDISESRVCFLTRLSNKQKTIFSDQVYLYPLRTEELVSMHQEAGFELIDHLASYHGSVFKSGQSSGSIFILKKTSSRE